MGRGGRERVKGVLFLVAAVAECGPLRAAALARAAQAPGVGPRNDLACGGEPLSLGGEEGSGEERGSEEEGQMGGRAGQGPVCVCVCVCVCVEEV